MEVHGITAWLFSPKQMGMCWPGWQNGGSVVGLGIMLKKKKKSCLFGEVGGHWGCLRLPGLVFGMQQGLGLPTEGLSFGSPVLRLILGTSRWGQVPADGTPECTAQPSALQKPPEMAAWCSWQRLGAGTGCSPWGLLPQASSSSSPGASPASAWPRGAGCKDAGLQVLS